MRFATTLRGMMGNCIGLSAANERAIAMIAAFSSIQCALDPKAALEWLTYTCTRISSLGTQSQIALRGLTLSGRSTTASMPP